MNPTSSSDPDGRSLSEADERVIDALLSEIQQVAPAPPDLTNAILRQLADRDWERDDSNCDAMPATAARLSDPFLSSWNRNSRRSWLVPFAGGLAIAASLMMILAGWDRSLLKGSSITGKAKSQIPMSASARASDKNTKSAQRPLDPAAVDENKSGSISIAQTPRPREGVPLVRSQPIDEHTDGTAGRATDTAIAADSKQAPVNDSQVLVAFNNSIATYWDRLGVVPASPLSDLDWTNRVKQRFGASSELTSEEDCSQLAARLVGQMMRNVPLVAKAREKMVAQAAEAIFKGEQFDRLVSGWVADDSLLDTRNPALLSQSLATNLLDVDATCARCHDSPVDGRFAQHDYWALASIFMPANSAPLFYELVDGRQRVAEADVPDRWLGENQGAKVDNNLDLRKQFSQALVGNRVLAGAIANRIWEVGFGAPLVSLASDPMAPPRDDALQTSHAMITDAILASNFDVRVAARLVMASDAMRRGQTDLYASGRWRIASEEAIADDARARRTFAAASQQHPAIGPENMIAMMESRIGNAPRELGSSPAVLAQPSIVDGLPPAGVSGADKPTAEEYLWADWIADRELLRGSWLRWIKNGEQQQHHALYAANMTSLHDEASLLKRLYSPSDDESIAANNAADRLLWVLRKSR